MKAPRLSHPPPLFWILQMTGVGAGTFFGTIQLAWYPDPVTSTKRFGAQTSDARAIVRTLARPAFWMSSAAMAFAAVECTAEAARGKKDQWNAAIGGLAGGAVTGAISRSAGVTVSTALAMGLAMFFLDASGPDTVMFQEPLTEKMYGVLPETHVESKALSDLKEKYPKYKDL